ncbi:APC family permease [Alkaliflexus imshenetskii]|uniref:APC family permease n=1 Tax=Alkaliflexus imshenetskii TaxID=286730 RepID=UPI0004B1EA88|nr:APC family permease [Alkaliflexus imshenetskii]
MESTNEGLKREIGVWGLSANIINIIVGAGIFVLPAIVAAGLGAASILAYLFCGILVILIMLCFAEAGSIVTSSGGAYAYIEAAFGRYAGFVTSALFIGSCVAADAAVANALVDLLARIFPVFAIPVIRILFFVVVFGLLAAINIRGVKRGIGLIKITTIAKLSPLLLLVIIGWADVSIDNLKWDTTPSITGIGQMALILFFAFQGGESALAVSGEVQHPQRTIPRAIFIAILGILTLYILIQTVAQGVLGSSLPAFSDAPLVEVAQHVFGPWGLAIMTAGAAVSMFGYMSGELLSMPRVLFGAARDKVIPFPLLARVHKKFATPYMAIAVYAGIGLSMAIFGGFRQLAIISGASILLVYMGVAFSVLRLRKISTRSKGAFRVPGGVVIPMISVLIILWFLSNLEKAELIGMSLFLMVLSLIFWVTNTVIKRKQR